jgi:hypothetical protein
MLDKSNENIDEIMADFSAAVKQGRKIGCEYYRVRIGQKQAFWQRHSFGDEIATEIFSLLEKLSNYGNKTLSGIKTIYLYGFKTAKKVDDFVHKVHKQREAQKIQRRQAYRLARRRMERGNR